MKVICINSRIHTTKKGITNDAKDYLAEGKSYTVYKTLTNKFNETGYLLKEVKSPSKYGSFSTERFIPCSDVDETILINYKTEIL